MPVGPLGPLGGLSEGLFGLAGAASESAVVVRATFSDQLDLDNPALLNPASYVIAPPATVHSVSLVSASAVRLMVDYLGSPDYLLTVTGMTSLMGASVDPARTTATFNGYASNARFDAVPVSRTKVRLLFESTMAENTALLDPASYAVADLAGALKAIVRVEAEGPPGARVAVALTLSDALEPTVVYVARVTSIDVTSSAGNPVSPSYSDFQYIEQAGHFAIPCEWFEGEGSGMAFFSPALDTPAPDSIVQVDQVSVCTRAFDSYTWPRHWAGVPLFLWADGLPPSPLGSSRTLFTQHERLSEVRLDLEDCRMDVVPVAVGSHAVATLAEKLDPARVARLNRSEWLLFNGATPTFFILADNLTPIPPGVTTTVVLEP